MMMRNEGRERERERGKARNVAGLQSDTHGMIGQTSFRVECLQSFYTES